MNGEIRSYNECTFAQWKVASLRMLVTLSFHVCCISLLYNLYNATSQLNLQATHFCTMQKHTCTQNTHSQCILKHLNTHYTCRITLSRKQAHTRAHTQTPRCGKRGRLYLIKLTPNPPPHVNDR